MSRKAPKPVVAKPSLDLRIAIVAARWNQEIVDELVKGCVARLKELGIDRRRIEIHRVPGAFELPFTAGVLANNEKLNAIIVLGCVIRGDTPHFDYVAGQCARGIMEVNLRGKIPVIFGVLTTNNETQARARIGGERGHAGRQSADVAVEMAALNGSIR